MTILESMSPGEMVFTFTPGFTTSTAVALIKPCARPRPLRRRGTQRRGSVCAGSGRRPVRARRTPDSSTFGATGLTQYS